MSNKTDYYQLSTELKLNGNKATKEIEIEAWGEWDEADPGDEFQAPTAAYFEVNHIKIDGEDSYISSLQTAVEAHINENEER